MSIKAWVRSGALLLAATSFGLGITAPRSVVYQLSAPLTKARFVEAAGVAILAAMSGAFLGAAIGGLIGLVVSAWGWVSDAHLRSKSPGVKP